jgi:arylsulfate sulfotransferase
MGTITNSGTYTAPSTPTAQPVRISIRQQSPSAAVSVFDRDQPIPGSVVTTQNPLVAAYSIPAPEGASVSVQFGADTSYGLSTSEVPAPAEGGSVTVLVAGMRANTAYHMQAVLHLADRSEVTDTDHVFTTGALPVGRIPNISTQVTGVGTPNPGIELLSLTQTINENILCAVATDLDGNLIWYYDLPVGAYPNPIKLLPNGHVLILTGGSLNDVREVDLAGNIISQITGDQITQSLSKITSFQNTVWGGLNHDVLPLSNGHLILLASIQQAVSNVPGITDGTVVQGNALIDWDPQRGAVWTWTTFDHLELSRAPYGMPDWTHGNAVIYSPDDGNLILSMRNQNWVVKIKYQDGAGDGSVLWRLGPDGDFTLPGQQAPMEWNYGQHYPTIRSSNSSGVFSLMLFNNGNNRLMDSSGDVCGSPTVAPCYSSVPIFELNEYSGTANLISEYNLSPAYSICCGDALVLPNGDVEFDVAADVYTPKVSSIEEISQSQSSDLVWRMDISGNLAYRGFRIPSLYRGVEWTQDTVAVANRNAQVRDAKTKLKAMSTVQSYTGSDKPR